MRFVLDHCVPRPLIRHLTGVDIQPAGRLGWAELTNGKLLAAIEGAGYDGLITVDKGFGKQQNMSGRSVSVLVLDARSTLLIALIPSVPSLLEAIEELKPGKVVSVRQPGNGEGNG